jgi:hypothetical protein
VQPSPPPPAPPATAAVELEMTIDAEIGSVGAAGTSERDAWTSGLRTALGARLGISAARIIVLSVSAGSVQVGLRIFDYEGLTAEATAADSASFLMTQLAASSSPLLLQQGYVVINAALSRSSPPPLLTSTAGAPPSTELPPLLPPPPAPSPSAAASDSTGLYAGVAVGAVVVAVGALVFTLVMRQKLLKQLEISGSTAGSELPPMLQRRAQALNPPGAWHFMISYTQRSERGTMLAQKLRASLKELGYTVWLDVRRAGSNPRPHNERSDIRCRYRRWKWTTRAKRRCRRPSRTRMLFWR